MTDIAIYIRVDAGKSDEMRRLALDSQRIIVQEYAEKYGYHVVECYEDDGFSGADLNRPGLKKMIYDFEAGRFEFVLVKDRDKLYRGPAFNDPEWPFEVATI